MYGVTHCSRRKKKLPVPDSEYLTPTSMWLPVDTRKATPSFAVMPGVNRNTATRAQ